MLIEADVVIRLHSSDSLRRLAGRCWGRRCGGIQLLFVLSNYRCDVALVGCFGQIGEAIDYVEKSGIGS